MTSKEALDKVKGFILELRDTKYIEYKKYTDILNDLVERDTPKKVITGMLGIDRCSECKTQLSNNKERFCKHCGQRLDWE